MIIHSLIAQLRFDKSVLYPENDDTFMGFAWADLNGDGLPDLTLHPGGWEGSIWWFEQKGSTSEWEKHLIASESEQLNQQNRVKSST